MSVNLREGKYIIYSLTDPRNGEIRYVGKSSSGLERPKCHFMPGMLEKSQLPVHRWIRKLESLGLTPNIQVLEEIEKERLEAAERHYIWLSKRDGDRLLNLTDGGEGTPGRKVSQEIKDRLSKMYTGRKISEKQKKMISSANKGRKHTHQEDEIRQANSPKRKHVLCVQTGIIYISVREAARVNGYDHRGIGRCCNGEYRQYQGFQWVFTADSPTHRKNK